jgi:hypothetical protein
MFGDSVAANFGANPPAHISKAGKPAKLAVARWTDVEFGKVTFYSIRLGYASTINKVQGDASKVFTFWLDAKNMPAVGYTPLSRVQHAGG